MAHSISLSVGEVLTIITILIALFGGIISTYSSLNVRIKALEVRVKQTEINQDATDTTLEVIRKENREDHNAFRELITDFINNTKKNLK